MFSDLKKSKKAQYPFNCIFATTNDAHLVKNKVITI